MAYKEELATVQELFESGITKERSANALRIKAKNELLFFVKTEGNVSLFDKQLSAILVIAAKLSKRRGLKWSDIGRAVKKAKINRDFLIKKIESGLSDRELISYVTQRIKNVSDTHPPPPPK